MTTFEYAAMRTRSIWTRLAIWLIPRRRRLAMALARGWAKIRPVSMTVAGLSCIVAGIFTISTLAGLFAAGVSFFIVDWLARPDERRR